MNIKEKLSNAKAWTAEKAGQAKEWCKDHSVEFWSAIATGTACFGCYLTGRIVERQNAIEEMVDIRDQALTYKQKYEDEFNHNEDFYGAGLKQGRLEGKIEAMEKGIKIELSNKGFSNKD
jgi:hypothetical protein